MTVATVDLALYAFALAVRVATPGPVVVATVARTLSRGWRSAMPLAAGVAVGDVVWPLLAIFGLSLEARGDSRLRGNDERAGMTGPERKPL